ncbi:MAG: UvrD-helicase domain-containing protein [Bacteroidales bacterium]|nr:UvrD-helicase domain-containing protein [Bacteroidales bacterium]
MSNLKVYQASAGSGKTYMLALQYIVLLFENPLLYRNILAVTFTNKAAGEMKSRIIEKLYLLWQGEEPGYKKEIKKLLGISDNDIQERAGGVLKSILHNYSYFSVQTIDSFFQKILRAFAMEMGLQYTYGLQLDQDKVLNAAADSLIMQADENKDVRDWLIRFSGSKIEEGKAWNVKQDILGLGKQLFSEKVKVIIPELWSFIEDKDVRDQYLNECKDIVQSFEKSMKRQGEEAVGILENQGLDYDSFTYKKSGPAGYFYKIKGGNDFEPKSHVRKTIDDSEKWVSGRSENRDSLMQIATGKLHPLLISAVEYYDQHYREYSTATLILQQFYTLGIYVDLENKIQEYARENNEFLISDLANFLNRIIDHNEVPFIYEKTGIIFRHFFLDEFQDTSVIQWNNFKPLISGSLSAGNMNMVVGDVKQSIYRWRNSDWKILGERVYDDFLAFKPESVSLGANYRSRENIVHFNNAFFSAGASLLQDKFNQEFDASGFDEAEMNQMTEKVRFVYKHTIQTPSRQLNMEEGQVNCRFFEGRYSEWKEPVDLQFPQDIKHLIKEGVQPGDIAILVRDHKDGKRAVDALMKYREENDDEGVMNFPIVSNESLYLKNSPPVRFLLNFLNYLIHPEDKLNQAGLYLEYQTINGDGSILDKDGITTGLFRGSIIETVFSDKTIKEITFLKKLSMPEILEGAIRLFKIGEHKVDVPYLLSFTDVVSDYVRENPGDIATFLEWWKEEGDKKSLQTNAAADALQVMTIHKAKGLQFGHVFMPYTSWSFDYTGNNAPVLWCKTNGLEAPFNLFPVIPVKYSKKLGESLFNKDYYTERLDAFIDGMNLLYVAFTRAEDSLWIYGPQAKSDIKNVSDLLSEVLGLDNAGAQTTNKLLGLNNMRENWKEDKKQWSIGELRISTEIKENDIEPVVLENYPGWPGFSRMRLKYQGEEYFSEERISKIQRGTLLHELFENIRTTEDVGKAVISLNEQGKINVDEIDELEEHVKELISNPKVHSWFSGEWEVRSEAGIILKSGKMRRPDRVMIRGEDAIVVDYKFGVVKKDSYRTQVRTYLHDMKQMGYENIQGFIWYVELGEVEEV